MTNAPDTNLIVLSALVFAFLSTILGFIALLKQKIYMDAATQQPVEVDIPIIGKMKTNYPALVFVILGFFLVIYILAKTYENPGQLGVSKTWTIRGKVEDPDRRINLWRQEGEIVLDPGIPPPKIEANGDFVISVELGECETPESRFKSIEYKHASGRKAVIWPQEEFERFNKKEKSNLIKALPGLRGYGSVPLEKSP